MSTARLQALRQVQTSLPARVERAPEAVWTPSTGGRSQSVLGNAVVSGTVLDGPGDIDSLYLADLLSASMETGEDLSAFLPWRASASWTQFVRAWYRVILAERERGDVDGSWFGADVDGGGTAAGTDSVEAGIAVDGAVDGVEVGDAGVEGSPLAGAAVDASVARDARGPDISDPLAMNDWFDRLERQSGAGRALTGDEQAFLEEVHGRRIPEARIHEGSFARDMAAQIDARAFTVGREVWMGEDVDLADPRGAELLAHEITHVIQNALGRGSTGKPVSSPSDASEREAEARGREGAALVTRGWGVVAPEGVGAQGRFLAAKLASQLPDAPRAAPPGLVQEGLRGLLSGRAEARIAALRAELAELDQDRADVREAAAQLDDARALVAAAGADAGSLTALLGIGGAPSAGDLDGLQVSFAPYPTFAKQAGALAASLAPPDATLAVPGADPALTILGGVRDVDPARALATAALVNRFAQSLRLSPGAIEVQVDGGAAERLSGVGAPGLYEGGAIYLDPAVYDPSTNAGAALLAHEMVHAAQDGLPSFEAMGAERDAGRLAEAEAHVAGAALVAGGTFHEVSMGLPDGHLAAKGNLLGDALRELLQALSGDAEAVNYDSPGTGPGGANKNATQNRREKLRRYKQSVDGIADEIGDLDAFDDLCDAAEDEEDKKEKKEGDTGGPTIDSSGPLARVKASEPYKKLCKMWQGAKEGGDDAVDMRAIFNNEFNGRGFWGSTEKAFDIVSANAKKDAKSEAIAEEGKKNAKDAAGKGEEEAKDAKDKGADGKTEAGKGGEKLDAKGAGGDHAKFLGASVEDEVPKIPSFETMNGVTDEQMAAMTRNVDEWNGFAEAAKAPGATDRTDQILGTLWDNFRSNFASNFTDQFIDSMVWDTIGAGGDKLLELATKGRVGGAAAPMIGPLLGLGKEVWSAYDSEKGMQWGQLANSTLGFEKFGNAGSSFLEINETLGNLSKAQDTGDVIGILFAAAADFFQSLRDLADGLATLCGTLSALSYIVGGVLILVGIATAWLGWGVGLITAGNWLVRIGSVLARINTALGLLVLFLSGIVTLFRTIAAFLVPATMYQEQLAGVGSAASNFGEKTGAKAGDMTANKIKDSVSRPKGGGEAGQSKTDGEQSGSNKHKDSQDAIDAQNKRLQDVDQGLTDAKKQLDQQKPKDDDAQKPKDDDGKTKAKGPGAMARVKKLADTLTQFSEIKNGLRELKELSRGFRPKNKDVRIQAAAEAMRPEVAQKTLENLETKIKNHNEKLKSLTTEIETAKKNGATEADLKELNAKLEKGRTEAKQAEADVKALRDAVAKVQGIDARLDEEKRVEDENKDKKKGEKKLDSPMEKELADRKKALDDADQKVKNEQEAHAKAKADAETRVKALEGDLAKAKEDAQRIRDEVGDPEAAKKIVADHDKQHYETEAKKRDDALAASEKLVREAETLEKQATDAEKASKLREDAKKLDTELETSRKASTEAVAGLEQHIGKNVTIKGGSGKRRTTDASIRGVEADGLIVTDGNGGVRKIPFSQVLGPADIHKLSTAANAEGKKTKRLEKQQTKLKEEADGLDPDGVDPKALRTEATTKRDEAKGLADQSNVPIGSPPKHDLTKKQEDASKLDGRAAAIQKQIDGINTGLLAQKTKVTDAQSERDAAKKALADSEATAQRMEDQKHANNYLRDGTSGNATGGVGSSYKWYGEALERILMALGAMGYEYATAGKATTTISTKTVAEPKEGEKRQKSIGTGLADLVGLKGRSDEALQKIGATQAAVERVLALKPPVNLEETKKKRLAAAEHLTKYKAAHAEALQAWKAEQAVEALSKETKKLADAGKPIEDASKKMSSPLQKSKGDEERRNAIISGEDPNAPKQEKGAGGIVGDLIMKLASHSDGMDQQPNAGSKDGGKSIETGQEKGEKDSKENVDRAKKLSDQQRAFLDEAIALRQGQETFVCEEIASMEQKYAEEQAIKAEIQTVKAKALADREAERAEVEKNASGFNSDWEQLEAWSKDYKERMADVAEASSK